MTERLTPEREAEIDNFYTLPVVHELLAEVAALRAELAEAQRERTWRAIETYVQEYPDGGRIVLLFAVTDRAEDGTVKNWNMATGCWFKARGEWDWDYSALPTHWMPLPAAPVESAERGREVVKRPGTLRGRIRPTRFGEMLRLYRTVNGLSLRDVAKHVRISSATLMRIEHGEAFDTATLFALWVWLNQPTGGAK